MIVAALGSHLFHKNLIDRSARVNNCKVTRLHASQQVEPSPRRWIGKRCAVLTVSPEEGKPEQAQQSRASQDGVLILRVQPLLELLQLLPALLDKNLAVRFRCFQILRAMLTRAIRRGLIMQAYCRKGKHTLIYYWASKSHGRDKYSPDIRLIFAYAAPGQSLHGVFEIVFCKLGISNAPVPESGRAWRILSHRVL